MVKSKDAKTLGEAMGNLLNNDEMRKKFSENCRKRALQNYSIDRFVDNYIEFYNKVIKEKKR